MPNIKNRTRVVYFRISEDEFSKLCGLREVNGARSVSELARSAIHALLQETGSSPYDELSRRLGALERSISEITGHLKILSQGAGSVCREVI